MNNETRITHLAFSDESHWNIGRYRALGLVTIRCENVIELEQMIRRLLNELGLSEFKWKEFKWNKLSGVRERSAALRMCDLTVATVCRGHMRIDVLIWDIEDSRHKVPHRDDVQISN